VSDCLAIRSLTAVSNKLTVTVIKIVVMKHKYRCQRDGTMAWQAVFQELIGGYRKDTADG